jgi:hypothetical protein
LRFVLFLQRSTRKICPTIAKSVEAVRFWIRGRSLHGQSIEINQRVDGGSDLALRSARDWWSSVGGSDVGQSAIAEWIQGFLHDP